ncbi:MAG: hypothetical protein ACWGHO_04140 [Candidatus Moraniibacteriota bacterium]
MKKISIKKIISWINFNKFKFLISIIALSVAASGGYLFAYAQQFIDSFLDTSRVANTWNVEVDTANGEVKLAQRSCDNSVWFCDLTHICPGLLGDGSQLLVRRIDASGQWKTSNTACNAPECGIDGGQSDNLTPDNTVSFNSLYVYYPARETCKAIGARLPTIAELQCIYYYRGSFGNNFGTGRYWSSTETGETTAYAHYFFYNRSDSMGKTDTNNFRCVRGW